MYLLAFVSAVFTLLVILCGVAIRKKQGAV